MLVTPCMLYPYLIELYSLRERKTREPVHVEPAFFIADSVTLCYIKKLYLCRFMKNR